MSLPIEADLARAVVLFREWLTFAGSEDGPLVNGARVTLHASQKGDVCYPDGIRTCVHAVVGGALGRDRDHWSPLVQVQVRFQRWAFRRGWIVEEALADRAIAFTQAVPPWDPTEEGSG